MIFYAVKHRRLDLVGYFLRQGVSPDVVGGAGLPLVIFALLNDYSPEMTDMVALILSFHANPNALPSGLYTPFVSNAGIPLDATDLPLWFTSARSRWEEKLEQKLYLLGR